MRHAIPTALACLMIGGCGVQPARIDATNRETAKASMKAVTDPMSEAQKKQFSADVGILTFPSVMKKAMTPGAKADEVDLAKPIDGLTAAEIHDRAETARAGLPRK